MPQLFFGNIPLATDTLCNTIQFDLSDVRDWRQLPARDHQAAAELACARTGLRPPSCIAAKSHVTDGKAGIDEARILYTYTYTHNNE